jgi:hypothetical protein
MWDGSGYNEKTVEWDAIVVGKNKSLIMWVVCVVILAFVVSLK